VLLRFNAAEYTGPCHIQTCVYNTLAAVSYSVGTHLKSPLPSFSFQDTPNNLEHVFPPSLTKHRLYHKLQRSTMTLVPSEFEVENVSDGETIHQRCVLLSGVCQTAKDSPDGVLGLQTTDCFGKASPTQNWPIAAGRWKALVMLNPGQNRISFKLHQWGVASETYNISLNYQPLTQLPPLHLAIMVAKDSPLLIDCPPAKQGAITTAHSTLESAIVKLRMAAYMWQALTAEDLRLKGLGRRSFRLDEEWGPDTTTREALLQGDGGASSPGMSARVHIVRSDRKVAQLRNPDVAQQNPRGRRRDDLYKYFEDALRAHGAPFASESKPVVAGLILDARYSAEDDLILGHAALGCHRDNGLSLGVFGSHTTYSWPRFLEEVPACLLDATPTGDTVGNDNGECDTMRGACFVGQGAFLHEVGHAFGADHTTGIMARGYSQYWSKNFIASHGANDARWDLEDALRFKKQPHFRLPGDTALTKEERDAAISITITLGKDAEAFLKLSCLAGIASVKLKCSEEWTEIVRFGTAFEPANCPIKGATFDGTTLQVNVNDIESQFDRTQPLSISVLGMNGSKTTRKDVWKLIGETSFIRIPGHDMVLGKQSVKSVDFDSSDREFHQWAMLLERKLENGELDRACSLELCVGCTMDGAVVHYESGAKVNCGLASQDGFGGHATETGTIPEGVDIAKVEINNKSSGWGSLDGIRVTLANGNQWGEINTRHRGPAENIKVLEPSPGDRIVGFYGQSDTNSGFTYMFGIVTAKKGQQLPDICHEMPELQNLDED
jgi:hypothetical protein